MTRYFYTDPTAAAWMAKHHAMRFVSPDGTEDLNLSRALGGDETYEVHAGSLELLVPQLGDLIERHDCFYFVVTTEEHRNAERVSALVNQTAALSVVRAWPHPEETFIRMRGGQVFIWPESA
jgi:hypothetical protein